MGKKMLNRILTSATLLALFGLVGATLVAVTYEATAERITANHREALLKRLDTLVPPGRYDNDMVNDTVQISDPALADRKRPVTVYRARRSGRPEAAVFSVVAPDGYNGSIFLLVAIQYDGTLLGVRVVSHRETPGLGDAIEERKSRWIRGFDGRSLTNPDEHGWRVKRDGGVFDQFTGATVTPRAVVKAVYRTLKYFSRHRDEIFALAVTPVEIKHE